MPSRQASWVSPSPPRVEIKGYNEARKSCSKVQVRGHLFHWKKMWDIYTVMRDKGQWNKIWDGWQVWHVCPPLIWEYCTINKTNFEEFNKNQLWFKSHKNNLPNSLCVIASLAIQQLLPIFIRFKLLSNFIFQCYRPQTWQFYLVFPALFISGTHKVSSCKFKGG